MFAFRVSAATLDAMKQKARRARLTLTDLIISSVMEKEITVIEDLIATRKELYAIGKNLNQLAVLANMGRISVIDLEFTKSELNRCHETLDQIRERVYS